MISQYEPFLFWFGQLASGNIRNPSEVDPLRQYEKYQNPTERTGRIGKYQMTENQMAQLGYYNLPYNDDGRRNEWRGEWTGRRGIKSIDDFLSSSKGQELIIREAMRCHWRVIRRHQLDELVGSKVRGVLLTESTLLAIAHLYGEETVVELGPGRKSLSDATFDALAVVAGFQTPYDINPNQNYYQKQFQQYLTKGAPITLNSELSSIPRDQVDEYVWCTQGDDKVRAAHACLEAQACRIEDSPQPGEDPNCRCWKESCISDSFNSMAYDLSGAINLLDKEAQKLMVRLRAQGKRPYGIGKCAHYVADAIEKGGKIVGGARPDSAKDFGKWLTDNGFVQVAAWDKRGSLSQDGYPSGYEPKAGDVVVIQAAEGHKDGHMAMYDGSQWVSDFVQNDIWGGNIRKSQPEYIIYRHRDD